MGLAVCHEYDSRRLSEPFRRRCGNTDERRPARCGRGGERKLERGQAGLPPCPGASSCLEKKASCSPGRSSTGRRPAGTTAHHTLLSLLRGIQGRVRVRIRQLKDKIAAESSSFKRIIPREICRVAQPAISATRRATPTVAFLRPVRRDESSASTHIPTARTRDGFRCSASKAMAAANSDAVVLHALAHEPRRVGLSNPNRARERIGSASARLTQPWQVPKPGTGVRIKQQRRCRSGSSSRDGAEYPGLRVLQAHVPLARGRLHVLAAAGIVCKQQRGTNPEAASIAQGRRARTASAHTWRGARSEPTPRHSLQSDALAKLLARRGRWNSTRRAGIPLAWAVRLLGSGTACLPTILISLRFFSLREKLASVSISLPSPFRPPPDVAAATRFGGRVGGVMTDETRLSTFASPLSPPARAVLGLIARVLSPAREAELSQPSVGGGPATH
ncbi:hypothetical protein CDD83_7206 [Cordyceps sp. RAO-2017]|nr:hypothetical protein CDD83_7206 [Cordyceps sp. RAO-2017]